MAGLFALACACTGSESSPDAGPDASIDASIDAGVSERRIFVTNTVRNASLGGIAGADALCATQAAGANLDGDFKAWLSTISSSASDRLTHSSVPYASVVAGVA